MSSERSTPGAPYRRERPTETDLEQAREQLTGRRLTDVLAELPGAHRLADGVVVVPLEHGVSGPGGPLPARST
jgi:hypothetical protein